MLFLFTLDILFSLIVSLVGLAIKLFFTVAVFAGIVYIFRYLTGRTE
ncbi:MAG: hypothetical protein K6A14_08795 [Erysipelotrichaceae bacterium]|nr:hypothetical protein [Erysipelotrichaceae bacterium]